MAQIFHRSSNTLFRVILFGGIFFVALTGWGLSVFYQSPYATEAGVPRPQPVPFSHKHHVEGLGLDCRYCHTSVETSAFAGMPATDVCMKCHTQIWSNAPMLAPVRESYRTGQPIRWTRVHNLADFAYFDHSIHLHKGIGCVQCHGRVQQMPILWRENSLLMNWCLDCHRQPEKYVMPRDQVFSTTWEPPADQLEQGRRLVKEYNIQTKQSCSICHR